MRTEIDGKTYLVHFFYGNPSNTRENCVWKKRYSRCKIFVYENDQKVLISEAIAINQNGEQFERAIGRKLSFLKAVAKTDFNEHSAILSSISEKLTEEFYKQCPSSDIHIVWENESGQVEGTSPSPTFIDENVAILENAR